MVVLTPFANRRHAEVDNVVGYFVSPFPLVTALEGKTFAQLAAGVQARKDASPCFWLCVALWINRNTHGATCCSCTAPQAVGTGVRAAAG